MSTTGDEKKIPVQDTYHQVIAKLFKQDDPQKHVLKCSPPQQLFYLLSQVSLQELHLINEEYHRHLSDVIMRMFSETQQPICDFSKFAGKDLDMYHNIARAIARAGHQAVVDFVADPNSALKLAQELKVTGKITTIFDMMTRSGVLPSCHIGLLMELASAEYVSTNVMQRLQMLKLNDPMPSALPKKGIETDETDDGDEEDEGDEEDLDDTREQDEAEVAEIQLQDYDYTDNFVVPDSENGSEDDEEEDVEEEQEE